MNETAKCRVCGRTYEIYNMICRDQSVCSGCERAAKEAALQPDTDEQKRKRYKAFR